jgi:DNA replicative helicase MCM subunit Mcm2 (Cdc46/Mcm family)
MATADNTELIDSFEEFYRNYYRNEIGELAQKYPNDQKSLYIDWDDLYRFDPDLADDYRTKPEQLQEFAEEALRLYDLPVDVSLGQAHVRMQNLPRSEDIRAIRHEHHGNLISIQGIVRKATDVRPKVVEAAFECQRCGTLSRIPQAAGDFQEPHECQGCERQGPFRLNTDQSQFIDAQKIRVQESPEGLRGGETPQAIDVNIEDDITGKVTAGDHVRVTGILKLDQQGSEQDKSPMFDIYMEGISIVIEDEQFEDMDITDADKKEIVELSNEPDIYDEMVGAIAPSIYGYEKEKLAMMLQLFSGVTKELPDGSRIRGDLHMLLIGDPGTGKCQKFDADVVMADGTERQLGELVESHLDDPENIDDGVYQETEIEVQTVDDDGSITTGTATKVWKREAPDTLYEIRTQSGRSVTVTPSHPLFVQSDLSLSARRADGLSEGEFLAIPGQLRGDWDNTLDVAHRSVDQPNANSLNTPDRVTPQLSRLLGYVIAEGHVSEGSTSASVTITNADEEIIEDAIECIESVGLHATRRTHHTNDTVELARCSSVEFVDFLRELDPAILEKSDAQRVPECLFRATPSNKRAFLRAYIDSEGTVSRKEREIAVGSMSRELLEDVQTLLLTFGITGHLEARSGGSYRLRISGEDFVTYLEQVGFVTARKTNATTAFDGTSRNTNTEIVPDLSTDLRRIRESLALSQFECGIPRTTYQHYERGDRNPSRDSLLTVIDTFEQRLDWLRDAKERVENGEWTDIEKLRAELNLSRNDIATAMGVEQTAVSDYERNDTVPDGGKITGAKEAVIQRIDRGLSVATDVERLRTLATADVAWDRIESIVEIETDEKWVYDLEVEGTHSYVSNGVVSHNSQMLSYIQNIAPRSVYTSGKGSSSAGLCVAGDTMIHTEDGFQEIRDVVASRIPEPVEAETSVESSLGLQTFDRVEGEMVTRSSSHAWRMPEKPCRRIETKYGKELEASVTTPLLTCGEDGIEWTDISDIEQGDYVAVPRYDDLTRTTVSVRDYLELTTEKCKLTAESVEFLRTELTAEFGTLREAAATLDLSEDFIYLHLKNRHVPLDKLDCMLDSIDATRADVGFERLMIRHGDSVTVPERFDADLMYLLGLVFGDGDISLDRRDGNRGMVRISNSDVALLERAADIFDAKFDKRPEIEYQDDRVPCIRVNSATIARLFSNVGMESPKAELSLDPKLTTAEHADAFLRGLMDADGAVSARDDGGSSVLLSTISRPLARQIQQMLETYDIRASVRERDRRGMCELPDGQTIESKHIQYFVEMYGADIDRYASTIGFEIPEKREVLDSIVAAQRREHDTIPVGSALAATSATSGEYHTNVARGDNPGRQRARSILNSVDLGSAAPDIEEAVEANLRWDKVVAAVDTGQKEVFDLTVPQTHNFVGDGLITHNTAAAVRDDFGDGQQWTLEAGALVLADQGIAAIDELDKMSCVTGDTLVHGADGITRIRDLAHEAATDGTTESLSNGRTIRDFGDLHVWTMTDDGRLVTRPVTAIHEYDAPAELTRVTLETGERLTATHDHPFFVREDGDRIERHAADLEDGDWVYVPGELNESAADGGVAVQPDADTASAPSDHAISPALASILGYLAGDGNGYDDRDEGVYGIRFTNAEEELLADFEERCRRAFDSDPVRPPSERRADGVETVRLPGKEYADAVLDAGMNPETYEGKRLPESVTQSSRAAKAAFLRALADSEGCVDDRNVRIHSSSYELLLGAKQLLVEFGVSTQIQTRERDERRDVYVLTITDADSLSAFDRHVGFALDRKQAALDAAIERVSGDRTILDMVPSCGDLLTDCRDSLRLYQSECGLADATYCNFENEDADVSLRCARAVLDAFETRRHEAAADTDLLDGADWDTLERIRKRYHVSRSELADATEYSQQEMSRYWDEESALRATAESRLRDIVAGVAATDLDPLADLVYGDVKWRRVDTVETVEAVVDDDRIELLREELAELLGCSAGEAVERTRELLAADPAIDDWESLREHTDAYDISGATLAADVGVDQSTVSRWLRGVVETDRFDEVRATALDRIAERRSQLSTTLDEIEARRTPSVYDLTVAGTHNFLANGMVVHNSEDRSAMHEALEQQSYHPDSEILLADGTRADIGAFVDERIESNADEVVDGVDCEILPVDDIAVHSVDTETNDVEKCPVDRISRHEAPDEFVKVRFSNGREVVVTPEHPMFVDDGFDTVDARDLEAGSFVPAPRKLPNSSAPVRLDDEAHVGKEKDVSLPDEITPKLGGILGFLIAGGHSYAGSAHEIGFSNQDERLLDRMATLMFDVFGMESTDTTNDAGTVTKRWVSTKLYRWFESNIPEFMATARDKRMPAAVLGASEEVIRRFLVGAFAGDGGVETEAMAFSTASKGLAEDYADALSKIGVGSRIHYNSTEDSWKTYVMGDSTETFVEQVVRPSDDRYDDARAFATRSRETKRHHDVLPTSVAAELRELRSLLGLRLTGEYRENLDEGYGVRVETVERELTTLRERAATVRAALDDAETVAAVREAVGWSGRELAERLGDETTSAIHYAEDGGYDATRRQRLTERAHVAVEDAMAEFERRADSIQHRTELRYYRVTDVETVPNEGEYACDWVYDVTVEPTNTFVSQGVVLHNSISISKAGINATLKSRCSLLGAANPKYGRFDQYEPIGEQIDLEPALISRFDLIFTVTDKPDEEKDRDLAQHIVQTNYAGELHTHRTNNPTSNFSEEEVETVTDEVAPTIEPEILRKYIAYAKRNCFPTLTEAAKETIEDFYVDLRMKGQDEDAPVPVTARKLEALVRLAEASARIRLSDTVDEEDADRAVEIAHYCLKEIGVDPETGEFDADVVETGQSKTQRDRIQNIRGIIADIEDEYDEGAPVDVVVDRAEEVGIDETKAEHEIEKLKQKGEVYEPRTDHLRTT